MTVPDFEVGGVPIRRTLRSLTRAGQVLVRAGRLSLLTSYGTEIDSAPVERVRVLRPWWALLRRGQGLTVLAVGGARYRLRLSEQDRGLLAAALRDAREQAAKIAADRRIVHP